MDEPAISVIGLSKNFKLPHEKNSSIKSAFVNFYRRRKSYEMQEAIKDVSFEIQKGEFFGIVGRNGSGKSTLLKILAGIYVPTTGEVRVNGKLTPFIELGVGFNPELTGRENVFLNGALLGFDRKQMAAMYKEIVDFAELKRFMDQKLKNYSSGMQVRLAFSIAIRARSDILLIDEVLAVGDAAFQAKCYNYFEKLKKDKKTVVFVSHDMNAVKRFCDRAMYIKGGIMTGIGEPDQIADIYSVENIQDIQGPPEEPESSKQKLSTSHALKSKVLKQTAGVLEIEFSYTAGGHEPAYIGLSVQREGVSIAEITTPLEDDLSGTGRIKYSLDLTPLNPGSYHIGAGLYLKRNRQLLAMTPTKSNFIIKGNDPTKGGSLKLEHNWQKEE
ncbi:MAG: hypothetical protein JWO96_116 [Candidatus Saccharibacteria bacterium]|nr:hypothetical protein [Candidatus Saccharibacteria bacterium]